MSQIPHPPQIPEPQKRSNLVFLEIVGLGSLWLMMSLVIIWQCGTKFLLYIYHLCQANWEALSYYMPASWRSIIPVLAIIILGRGIFLIAVRLRATRKFTRTLALSQRPLPPRLVRLMEQVELKPHELVCFETPAVWAFSLGAWRPQVWLSTGLLALLDDEELLAVLQHETHHCRQRDPLRRLISRLIGDIFFFAPLLCRLVDHSHLAQEMAADASVIAKMGDTIPLASALHKLLTVPAPPISGRVVAMSQINITERRILALVSPEQRLRWQFSLLRWGSTLLLVCFLFGLIFLPEPMAQETVMTCLPTI